MDDNSVKRNTLVSHMKHTIPSSCCCNLKWNGYHSPPLPPRPSPNPNPNPNPDPTLHRTTPFHPPARPTDHHRESDPPKYPNDNALFQHVCFATNHGGLTLIESTIIVFPKHLSCTHDTYTMLPPLHRHVGLGGVGKPHPAPSHPHLHHHPPTAGHREPHNRNNHNLQIDDNIR